jgi:putative tryptophan/tyrosine transport system substrate-binding protein
MRRREFIAGLAGAASVWPRTARAQRRPKPLIGFFSPNSPFIARPWTAAFVDRLSELGWIEDRTVAIVYRWGEGRTEHAANIVAELVGLQVDVIVTHGAPSIAAAKEATSVIPVVFAVATDPVDSGFVASLARPGGNVTGLSLQGSDLAGKRVELLREILPGLRRLAIMGEPGTVRLEMAGAEAAARAFGLEIAISNIHRAEEIAPAFVALSSQCDALYVCATPLVNTHRAEINALALAAKLPTLHGFREAVEAGALISYGPNFPDLFRRTADFVDKILRGSKPADLPVEQPVKFDLVVNLKTAQGLGVAIPPTLLARADEVIE